MVISRRGGESIAAPVAGGGLPLAAKRRSPRAKRDGACFAEPVVGVLMTGMGNDGAGAMTRLRAAGGSTIAEAEETAVVWGMPGELVKSGGATWVLPAAKIADNCCNWRPSCR